MRYRRLARPAMACASLLMLALVLLGGPAGASGLADSPWPMYQHDPQHTGRSPYVGPQNPAILWSFAPERGSSLLPPAIGEDGTLYVAGGRLTALSPHGAEKWRIYIHGTYFPSTPTISADGTIYATASVASSGEKGVLLGALYAFAPDGRTKWWLDVSADVRTPPVVGADGTVHFMDAEGMLYAVNSEGEVLWRFAAAGENNSPPVMARDGTIYLGAWDALYAIAPDGAEKWRLPWQDGGIPGAMHWIALDDEGTLYVTASNALRAIRADGVDAWRFEFPGGDDERLRGLSAPALGSDGTIYIGRSDGQVYAIGSDGQERWNFETEYVGWQYPHVALDGSGIIYAASPDHNLYALDPNGAEKWRIALPDRMDQPPVVGGDGRIYVVTRITPGVHAVGEANAPTRSSTPMSAVLGGLVVAGGLGLYLTRAGGRKS